jgi:NAD(P)-dependent dehydrogenase (short-subunit alcohol dehydrogenase family)
MCMDCWGSSGIGREMAEQLAVSGVQHGPIVTIGC